MMYDIAIIGLGPAGSTLARLLGGRFKIAAIDKKSGESGFHKPCGGLLAPDAQKALARLDLTLPREIIVDPQIFSVRTIDLDSGETQYYQRFYINLDRHKFDLWMRSLIPREADVFEDAVCKSVIHNQGGWEVGFLQGGKWWSIRARYLVGADGAASLVRGSLYRRMNIRHYVSIQQWFDDPGPTPFYSCIFDSDNTDCYSWALSKDGSLIFGGAYPATDSRARFERQKAKLADAGIMLGAPRKTEACLVMRPAGPHQFCTGRSNAFLIGEAAGFVSPSSLEGISSALNSAMALADVLDSGAGNPDHAYFEATFPLRLRLTGKLLKCPFMYRPGLRRLVMESGLSAIQLWEQREPPAKPEAPEAQV